MKNQSKQENPARYLSSLEGNPGLGRLLPFSLQQILAMFVSNMIPISVVGAAASPALSRAEILCLAQSAMIAAGIATFFRALGLKDVCLFGASQGGMIALVLALEYPELVGRMALGSSSAHVQPEQFRQLERWIGLARQGARRELYLAFGRAIYPPAVFEQCRDQLLAAADAVTEEDLARFVILAEGTRGFDVSDRLSGIQCPVLALGVYEDGVLDADATMEIAEKLDHRPDFKLYLYVGYGHAAYDTAPDYRERLLRFFLS